MLVKIYPENPNPREIAKVVKALQDGELIVYPTDTVYAIGCDALNVRAVERICRMKGVNPQKSNLSIICSDLSNLSEYAKVNNATFKLMKKNLPGPFTFILPTSSELPKIYKNRKEVGIRVPDNNIKLMSQAMREAAKHDGCAVIEVLDNCVIFNDKAHAAITGKDVRDDHQLILEHGKPMIFGRDRNKGIRLNGTRLEVVEIGKDGITERNILVHDQYSQDPGIHLMLAKMHLPEFPVAMGVIRSAPAATYNQLLEDQIEKARKESKIKCMDDLLNSGDTWEIN